MKYLANITQYSLLIKKIWQFLAIFLEVWSKSYQICHFTVINKTFRYSWFLGIATKSSKKFCQTTEKKNFQKFQYLALWILGMTVYFLFSKNIISPCFSARREKKILVCTHKKNLKKLRWYLVKKLCLSRASTIPPKTILCLESKPCLLECTTFLTNYIEKSTLKSFSKMGKIEWFFLSFLLRVVIIFD